MLSNEYLLVKIGVDTAENEPLKVGGVIQFNISIPSLKLIQSHEKTLQLSRGVEISSLLLKSRQHRFLCGGYCTVLSST